MPIRFLSIRPLPDWLRILGWGLLASLILHWVVLDLMRASLPARQAVGRLEVRLEQEVPPARTAEAPVIQTPGSARLATAPVAAKPAPSKPSPVPVMAAQAAPTQAEQQSAGNAIRLAGMRSGQPAEATVAMRLALAEALTAERAIFTTLRSGVLVWCDFDAAGHLVDVRNEAGAMPPALATTLRRVVGQVAVPEVLLGRSFSLDLLLELDQ